MMYKRETLLKRIAELRRVGLSQRAMAKHLGISRAHLQRLLYGEGVAPAPAPARQRRRCLCCGAEFMSAGPMNRLCGTCRKKSVANEFELYIDC